MATIAALHDFLPEDGCVNDLHDRGKLASHWLRNHTLVFPNAKACALDDLDLGYRVMGIPIVMPHPDIGLTDYEARLVITVLGEVKDGGEDKN